jgi:hypothetical protein
MRWVATREFVKAVTPNLPMIQSVAVVGGSVDDPEIAWLLRQPGERTVHVYGHDVTDGLNSTKIDLNVPLYAHSTQQFDLVHCAHVLEHIWDVRTGMSNLLNLARPGGIVCVNAPACCHAHGSPGYYAAGFQALRLSQLAASLGGIVPLADQCGSRRSYFYEHTLRRWPERREYEAPLYRMSSGRGGRGRAMLRWVKYLPGRLRAAAQSPRESADPSVAVQSWILVRSP